MSKRILVIEDNEQNRILMRQILKHHSYEVLEAADGAAGLAMAKEHMPDLILLDLQMPVMGGFAVIQEMRNTPALSHLKVMAVTSFAMKGDREKALGAGFNEYVTKPIDTRKFVELVKTMLPSEDMPLKKPIVLCVDDEPANLKLLENILTPRGYQVVSAENGEDALRIIKNQTIDLVLLDLMMPRMDGLQVSRKIKENKKYRNIPIIMLTAYSGAESYIESLSGEVFAYLHKPFVTEQLVKMVKAALEHSAGSRALPKS